MARSIQERRIRAYYQTLHSSWGNLHWWPAHTRFEVIVGAFLTQNTAWTNAELALRRLRRAGMLNLKGFRRCPLAKLEKMIRSAGYFRQKSRRLKAFVRFVDSRYGGSLARMFAQPSAKLREELLALDGIGPETADSILLYAGHHPVFVVDAYARRILERHGLVSGKATYDDIRALVERALAVPPEPPLPVSDGKNELSGVKHRPSAMSRARRGADAQAYNQMHAFLVGLGKNYCLKSQPRCELCPLHRFLP